MYLVLYCWIVLWAVSYTHLDVYKRQELTSAPRSGILRFTYPESEKSRIQIDLARRIGGTSDEQYVEKVDEYTIRGWMKCTPACGGWGNGSGKSDYTVYFYCCFDRPLTEYGVWSASIPEGVSRKNDANDNPAYFNYIKAVSYTHLCIQRWIYALDDFRTCDITIFIDYHLYDYTSLYPVSYTHLDVYKRQCEA